VDVFWSKTRFIQKLIFASRQSFPSIAKARWTLSSSTWFVAPLSRHLLRFVFAVSRSVCGYCFGFTA
jgi:hypothetical protein